MKKLLKYKFDLILIIVGLSALLFGFANKMDNQLDVITLEEHNTIYLNDAITPDSVQQTMDEFKIKGFAKKTMYLVINSPGGEVQSGNRLITFLKAQPYKVDTITLHAASMAFHLVQNLDKRLIIPDGEMMSHRIYFTSAKFSIPIVENTYLGANVSDIRHSDEKCAQRMSMSYDNYIKLITPEFWVYGQDAVAKNAADKMVYIKCGKTLKKCPLDLM